jgi:hypothetical protein
VRRVALHRLGRLLRRARVISQAIEENRECVRGAVIVCVRRFPHFQRLARLQLVAGDAVVVLIRDVQPLALADPRPVIERELCVLLARTGLAEPAENARERGVSQRELRIDVNRALQQRHGFHLRSRGAFADSLGVRLERFH